MTQGPIQVNSEIGRLKTVLLKRPGKELENLVPDHLSGLLFDDIPYLCCWCNNCPHNHQQYRYSVWYTFCFTKEMNYT